LETFKFGKTFFYKATIAISSLFKAEVRSSQGTHQRKGEVKRTMHAFLPNEFFFQM
jgi:hypothetical protein